MWTLFDTAPKMAHTLRVLACLLRYPDDSLRTHAAELRQALREERALGAARLTELDALLARITGCGSFQAEAEYVEIFDRGRSTALHLFEHVHGDSRERGPALVDLAQTYEAAGLLLAPGELPDYLPVVLEFASTQPPAAAREFLRESAHIVRSIFAALQRRASPYAAAAGAVLELAGESAAAVTMPTPAPEDEPLDSAWAEPPAFGGCSSRGQARPGQPQPIQIHKRGPERAQPGVMA
jgi:nitrate reductase molybdenum cofactor assembly chaperone NarJ/NarW